MPQIEAHFDKQSVSIDQFATGLEAIRAQLERFLEVGPLTEIQRRRFTHYCIRNLSIRKIAATEGVRQFAVWKSLQLCQKKFQKFLDKQGGHPPA